MSKVRKNSQKITNTKANRSQNSQIIRICSGASHVPSAQLQEADSMHVLQEGSQGTTSSGCPMPRYFLYYIFCTEPHNLIFVK
jgi:hypothetical protein